MSFLVLNPLTYVDLDFTKYLENTGFAEVVTASMPPQTVTVPTIASPAATTIDFNGVLLNTLNVIPSFTVPITTHGSVPVPAVALSGTVTIPLSGVTLSINVKIAFDVTAASAIPGSLFELLAEGNEIDKEYKGDLLMW